MVRFYGVIVANLDERPSTSQELQVQYPDPMPYSDNSDSTYYLTAGWNSGIPSTFTIGDKSSTTATRSGRRETYENAGLSRRTLYDVIVIVYLDSGVPNVRRGRGGEGGGGRGRGGGGEEKGESGEGGGEGENYCMRQDICGLKIDCKFCLIFVDYCHSLVIQLLKYQLLY